MSLSEKSDCDLMLLAFYVNFLAKNNSYSKILPYRSW